MQISKSSKNIKIDLALLLVVCVIGAGLLIRFDGVWWGMPDLIWGDESNTSNPAQGLLNQGSYDYYHYFYPQTFTVFQIAAVLLVNISRMAVGTGPTWLHHGLWEIYLIGRFTSLAMSIGAMVLIFLIGRKAYNSWVGLGAALFLAVYPAFVEYSTYAKPDVGMIFFALLSIYLSLFVLERGAIKDYILVGLAIGLATGVKYQGIIGLVSFLAAHLLLSIKQRKTVWQTVFSWPLLAAAVCVIGGYLVGNLHQFVRLHDLLADTAWFQLIFNISSGGQLFSITNLLITAGALLVLLIRKNPYDLIIGPFTLLAYFLVGHSRANDQMLFYIPFFIVGSAFTIGIVEWLITLLPRFKPLFVFLLLVFTAWEIYPYIMKIPQILDATAYYASGSRVQARNWVFENIPAGAKIIYSSPDSGGAAELPGDMYVTKRFGGTEYAEGFLNQYTQTEPNYVILTSQPPAWVIERAGMTLVKEFKDAVPPQLFGARASSAPRQGFVDIYATPYVQEAPPNMYSTLRLNEPRSSAMRSASFDDPGQVSKDWFFNSTGAGLDSSGYTMEVVPQGANGANVLHLRLSNTNGSGKIEAVQVVPQSKIDEFSNFQMSVFPVDDEIVGCCARINLQVTATSLGGAELGERTYHLFTAGDWDWKDTGMDVSAHIPTGDWGVFARNIRLDLERSGVRWDWVGFLVVRLQVETSQAGSAAGVNFGNIQTSAMPLK